MKRNLQNKSQESQDRWAFIEKTAREAKEGRAVTAEKSTMLLEALVNDGDYLDWKDKAVLTFAIKILNEHQSRTVEAVRVEQERILDDLLAIIKDATLDDVSFRLAAYTVKLLQQIQGEPNGER